MALASKKGHGEQLEVEVGKPLGRPRLERLIKEADLVLAKRLEELEEPKSLLAQGAAILDSEGHEGVAEDVAEHPPLVGLRTLSRNKAGRGGPSDAAHGNH